MGAALIVATRAEMAHQETSAGERHGRLLLSVVLYGLLIDPSVGLVEAVGRNATLTGRIDIWKEVLPMTVTHCSGPGMRVSGSVRGWRRYGAKVDERPNQAHNGYLEVYLDLGWVGIALLGLLMAWGYRGILRALHSSSAIGRLKLAFFPVAASTI